LRTRYFYNTDSFLFYVLHLKPLEATESRQKPIEALPAQHAFSHAWVHVHPWPWGIARVYGSLDFALHSIPPGPGLVSVLCVLEYWIHYL